MRIWIDLANSPHVPFFRALIPEFMGRGHQVEISARDFAQTVKLATKAGLLPDDVVSSDSTGYAYSVKLSSDKKKYSAEAVPAVYGKTGKLSFTVELNDKRQPHLASKDYGK